MRATGTIQALRLLTVKAPRIQGISGQRGNLTLTYLTENGATVKEGQILAEFDRIPQLEAAREARAKYEDLSHQVEQKEAENRSEAEKRLLEMEQAEADLAKARIQLRKGSVLAEIERLKNEVQAADAEARVASLRKSHEHRTQVETSALRILELQRDRQRVALERALSNAERLVLTAPHDGMVALASVWRSGSFGQPQVGDQVYRGQPLLRIFDPSEMEVHAQVAEPDGAALVPGCRALVRLDAYPGLEFTARLESASPVASSALGSPIKTFFARFRLEQTDPHLLPDLSAAVILQEQREP